MTGECKPSQIATPPVFKQQTEQKTVNTVVQKTEPVIEKPKQPFGATQIYVNLGQKKI